MAQKDFEGLSAKGPSHATLETQWTRTTDFISFVPPSSVSPVPSSPLPCLSLPFFSFLSLSSHHPSSLPVLSHPPPLPLPPSFPLLFPPSSCLLFTSLIPSPAPLFPPFLYPPSVPTPTPSFLSFPLPFSPSSLPHAEVAARQPGICCV